jgi:hypothetical protein
MKVGVLPPEAERLQHEGEEISMILAVIVIKSKRRLQAKAAGIASVLIGITEVILHFEF